MPDCKTQSRYHHTKYITYIYIFITSPKCFITYMYVIYHISSTLQQILKFCCEGFHWVIRSFDPIRHPQSLDQSGWCFFETPDPVHLLFVPFKWQSVAISMWRPPGHCLILQGVIFSDGSTGNLDMLRLSSCVFFWELVLFHGGVCKVTSIKIYGKMDAKSTCQKRVFLAGGLGKQRTRQDLNFMFFYGPGWFKTARLLKFKSRTTGGCEDRLNAVASGESNKFWIIWCQLTCHDITHQLVIL